jgi:hypothetical protein
MNATIRPYRIQDLGRVLRLWEARGPLLAGDGLTVDQAVELINADSTVAVVGEESSGAKPTVTEEMAEGFSRDAEQYTRF